MALVLPQISFRRPYPLSAKSQPTQPNWRRQLSNPKSTQQLPQNFDTPSSPDTTNPPHGLTLPQLVTCLCKSNRLNKALVLILEDDKAVYSRLDRTEKRHAIEVLLQTCGDLKEIEVGRRVHEIVSNSAEFRQDLLLNARLIMMYCLCGFPAESRAVFDRLKVRNLFVWNAIVSGYAKNELYEEVIMVFCDLISATELKPDNFTLPCVIKACGGLSQIGLGQTFHGMAIKIGLVSDMFVANALLSMYGKLGFLGEAVKMFVKMPDRNLVTWNSMLSNYSENGCYADVILGFLGMLAGEMLVPDVATIVTILPAFTWEGDPNTGVAVHGLAVKLGLDQHPSVANTLMDMYAKCGFSSKAEMLFEKIEHKTGVSWNSMIGNYSRRGDSNATFGLIRKMQVAGGNALVDEITILNALPACLENSALMRLKELHGYSLRHGFTCHELVCNSLIAAYAKCGEINYAESTFSFMDSKAVNSWNALINAHIQHGDPRRGLNMFLCMTFAFVGPDCYSLDSVLSACQQLRLLKPGKEIHGFVLRNALEQDPYISVSLLSFYFRCEKWLTAEALFDTMTNRNPVSWNTMISGYLQSELLDKAVEVFRKMLLNGIEPCEIAITSLLSVCSKLPSLRLGKEVHCFALKTQLINELFVSCSAIDMYAKCGCIEQSRGVFNSLTLRSKGDVAPWNVMITGLGIHGNAKEAMELFHEMQVKPDALTFTGLLMACNHAGLINEGVAYFTQMHTFYGIIPRLEHYACVVDMLGRAGRLDEALWVVERMPEKPDAKIWSSLLNSCRLHGHLELGRRFVEKLVEMEPEKADNYVSVSNLMAQSGKWDDVRSVRKKMRDMGSIKVAGCSWIDVGGKIHNFVAGDDS